MVSYKNLAHEVLLVAEATQLLRDISVLDVSVIVLKGLALLGRVYPESGQRKMYDVDLLVRYEDWGSIQEVLEARGYKYSDEGLGCTQAFAWEYMHQVPYRKGVMVVDLHRHLVALNWYRQTTALDLESLWMRAVSIEIAGAPALRLCTEDELIHLCYHVAVHNGLAYPKGYRDIVNVLRLVDRDIDWPMLVERARAWRVSVAVWAALSVARGRNQESRIKNQESRIKNQATSNENHASRITHHEEDLIPESALDALRVPRWRQWLLRPFVRRAMGGEAALVSGTMRFLGVLLVDRVRDLPGVVLHGLFPGRRWLQLRYDLSPRQAFWRQFTYPFQVLARGVGALLTAVIRHS